MISGRCCFPTALGMAFFIAFGHAGVYACELDLAIGTATSAKEDNPGGHVGVSYDDDNEDGTADKDDGTTEKVTGENDLVSLTITKVSGGLPLLIPGVGAQGGDLEATVRSARGAPFLVNSSRGISGASRGRDFADAAAEAARRLHEAIQKAEEALVGT